MSILSVPKLKPIVDNWKQFLAQREFKLTVEMNSTSNQTISVFYQIYASNNIYEL